MQPSSSSLAGLDFWCGVVWRGVNFDPQRGQLWGQLLVVVHAPGSGRGIQPECGDRPGTKALAPAASLRADRQPAIRHDHLAGDVARLG